MWMFCSFIGCHAVLARCIPPAFWWNQGHLDVTRLAPNLGSSATLCPPTQKQPNNIKISQIWLWGPEKAKVPDSWKIKPLKFSVLKQNDKFLPTPLWFAATQETLVNAFSVSLMHHLLQQCITCTWHFCRATANLVHQEIWHIKLWLTVSQSPTNM